MKNSILLSKNHLSLQASNEIKNFCSNFFQVTSIGHFTYSRLYPNGKILVLVSDPEYHKYFWDMKYEKEFFLNYKEGTHSVDTLNSQALFDATKYGIHNPVMSIFKRENYFEGFGFAAKSPCENPLNFYLSNSKVMNLFAFYFKNEGLDFIRKSEDHLISTPYIMKNYELSNNKINEEPLLESKVFYVENYKGEPCHLTKQEYKVLKALSKGMSAKGIARELCISHRTVEQYIINIKHKTGFSSKELLIKMFYNSYFPYTTN